MVYDPTKSLVTTGSKNFQDTQDMKVAEEEAESNY
jgi:hypothetical protein